MACVTCKFYDSQDPIVGECKVNPPQVVVIDEDPESIWPTVSADDWCGQWEAIDGTTQSMRGLVV